MQKVEKRFHLAAQLSILDSTIKKPNPIWHSLKLHYVIAYNTHPIKYLTKESRRIKSFFVNLSAKYIYFERVASKILHYKNNIRQNRKPMLPEPSIRDCCISHSKIFIQLNTPCHRIYLHSFVLVHICTVYVHIVSYVNLWWMKSFSEIIFT